MWTSNDNKKFGEFVKSFFGGDEKALGFVQANYKSSQFDQAVDIDEKDLDSQTGKKEIVEMMKAGNYSTDSEDPKMAPNDVHYQFTDFIIRTALFHRELDPPEKMALLYGGSPKESSAYLKKIGRVPTYSVIEGEQTVNDFLGKTDATVYEIISAVLLLAKPGPLNEKKRFFDFNGGYADMTANNFAKLYAEEEELPGDQAEIVKAFQQHMNTLAVWANNNNNPVVIIGDSVFMCC